MSSILEFIKKFPLHFAIFFVRCLFMFIFFNSLPQGVQPLLDGVLNYLPCPVEVSNYALDQTKNEEKVQSWGSFILNICFPNSDFGE